MTHRGFAVDTALSGEMAKEMFYRGHYPIVIADYMMPGIDGLELLQQLRATHPETRVIIVSGFATDELEASALDLRAAAFIAKPWDESHLLATVEAAWTAYLQDLDGASPQSTEPPPGLAAVRRAMANVGEFPISDH